MADFKDLSVDRLFVTESLFMGGNELKGLPAADEPSEPATKQQLDAAAGGAGIPVLTSDPGAPIEDQQWILKVPLVEPSFLKGGGMSDAPQPRPPALIEDEWGFNWTTPTQADLDTFFISGPLGSGSFGFAFQINSPSWSFANNPTLGLLINTPSGALVNEVAGQFDTWSVANLTGAPTGIIAFIGSLGTETIAAAWGNPGPGNTARLPLDADGTPEAMTLKVQGASKVFEVGLS